MARKGSICIIDDNKGILKTLQLLLSEYFKGIYVLSTPEGIPGLFREHPIDVVLLDMNFSAGINNGNEGLYWLNQIKNLQPRSVVILFTAYAYIDLAVAGIKAGAFDFVTKPWENDKLIGTLLKARGLHEKEKEAPKQDRKRGCFRGESETMKKLYQQIEKVAITDANILITGENGTGKEVIAREIHELSRRKNKNLEIVDMGALTESLFESELFGHVKGAFTDARTDRPGKFEIANGGTLFLDEIGNLPYHLQAKLLTVLQRRQVVPVGSNQSREIDIRLICATNCNLPEMVRKGTFREDLYYRINTITLALPPLRERKEDLIPMAQMFAEHYASVYDKESIQLGNSAIQRILSYGWPGNVRELQHTLEKAVIMGDNILEEADLNLQIPEYTIEENGNQTLEELEKRAIRNALEQSDGNLSVVAQQLGITRQTLYNKIKRYHLL